jgi:hypothetical protein
VPRWTRLLALPRSYQGMFQRSGSLDWFVYCVLYEIYCHGIIDWRSKVAMWQREVVVTEFWVEVSICLSIKCTVLRQWIVGSESRIVMVTQNSFLCCILCSFEAAPLSCVKILIRTPSVWVLVFIVLCNPICPASSPPMFLSPPTQQQWLEPTNQMTRWAWRPWLT